MGMIDRMARWAGYERRSAPEVSWDALAPALGYPAAVSARAAENLAAVLGCVQVQASALGSIPAGVYRRAPDGTRLEEFAHPLARLIRLGANDAMTWPEFIEHLVASTLLTGNGLAAIERAGNGQISGLRFIPWAQIGVVELRSGRLAYDWSDPLTGRRQRFLQGEVIHLRDRTDDGKIGRSRLSRAADTMAGIQSSHRFARSFLDKGAAPSGYLKVPGALTPEQLAKFREQMAARNQGAGNAGQVMILDGGIDWVNAQISPEDAELLETRKFGVEEICRIFQVPPPLIQDYSHNTFTNSETAGRWFAMFTLTPWARKIEAEFARSVFPASSGLELELDLGGFLRGDPKTRWDTYKIARETDVLTADEIRQLEGWNPRGDATGVTQ
ncbi:MAG: phage portal protein [Proteobacteria bacterium SG_bin6]|nr:MAG: phage portal protein [Proteobacteria bacterium SG_bin6]